MTSRRPLILVHGGAGRKRLSAAQAACLAEAIQSGYELLRQGAPAVLAVEAAIGYLEGSGRFNAGLGSNRQLDGIRRMDASIMEGKGLRAGAVASVEGIVHPITAARLVMEETDHVLLVGPLAGRFARHFELERFPDQEKPRRFSFDRCLTRRRRGAGHGTVGAVAWDASGTLAAGASTGGIDAMIPGRVGDTPLIGCGVYADNRSGAVSMTGIGEGIVRLAIAKTICDHIAAGTGPLEAAKLLLRRLVSRIKGSAGSLVIAGDGTFGIAHVTPHMAAGWWNGKGRPEVRDRWM